MSADLERRARRLVALYPREWRDRFGEELEQLMVDEMRERRRSLRRDGDVVAHALLARLASVGLAGGRSPSAVRTGRALGLLGIAIVAFFTVATGMWSQVALGWAWATPAAEDTRIALRVMSAALAGLGALLAAAALLALAGLVQAGRRRSAAGRRPALVAVSCGGALLAGCWIVGSRWPGAGTAAWSRHNVVPAIIARLGWAGTLFIDARWAHPATLLGLPPGRLAWMAVSPVLLTTAVAFSAVALRRVDVAAWVGRAAAALAAAAVAAGCLFVAGAAVWILDAGAGPGRVFEPGSVDGLGLATLVVSLLLAGRLARRGLGAWVAPRAHGPA